MTTPRFAGATDTGRAREHNEDAFAIAADLGIALLADGMGGHAAGEVASELAIGTAMTILGQTRGLTAQDRLETAVRAANGAIRDKAATSPRLDGMGTTLVAVLLEGERLTVAHVGDSRLYRLRRGELAPLTRDHSLQQELVDKGLYSADEARRQVPRNMLTRALGQDEEVRVDIAAHDVRAGDRYLICSDGLYEMVGDSEITALLGRNLPLPALCTALIELANAHGGKDNVSVITIAT